MTTTLAAAHLTDVLAKTEGPEFGKASPMGLLVVLLLLAGTVFLIWSMNRHLRGLPKKFDWDNPEADQAADDGTDGDPRHQQPR
ncbi:hypothetical protein [Williamsia soli]|uniref:hypothetical protein n=1 Tax=Williamsia soli TaxID=364929 RepID=UPI001A9D97B8|nr:hypothetical protein [Williamsia soli]